MRKPNSNDTKKNWILRAPGAFDRIEACVVDKAYAPHRHDTYTIGFTIGGTQKFDYRGETRYSKPGQMVILHPGELHDGRPDTDEGFHYRTLYLKTKLVQQVIGGNPLPYIKGGISSDKHLHKILTPLLTDFERPLADLEYQDAVYDLATRLDEISDTPKSEKTINYRAARTALDYIDDNFSSEISLTDLAQVAQCDRWQLSRFFRSAFGTSPYRYSIHRRLDKASRLLLAGSSIADSALDCGFSDQSHFGRHFKNAFGLSPKAWIDAVKH